MSHALMQRANALMQRANARLPKSFTKPAPTSAAAVAVQRAIERRSRRAALPRSNAPLLWAPNIIQRLVERRTSSWAPTEG